MQKSIYMKRFEESWGVEVEKSWGYNPWNSRIEGVMDEETAGVGGHIKSSIADHVLVPKRVWEYSSSEGWIIDETLTVTGDSYTEIVIN